VPFERWGSLSVDDHTDTAALIAHVLLFDRLIVPVMTEQVDRNERAYWVKKGWDPDLQLERLDVLEDLAIRRPWDAQRRASFQTRIQELTAEQHDAEAGKHLTRMILAQETPVEKPPDVDGVTVVPAYSSRRALERDFPVEQAADHLTAQAYLLSRRLAVPKASTPTVLAKAVKLSRDPEFRTKRADLFDWQAQAVATGWSPEEAVARVSDMSERYNAMVQDSVGAVRWKFAFTLFGIGLAFATGGPIGATAAAGLSLVQFAKFDRKPDIQAGSTQPAAAFHDVRQQLGIELRKPSS
jgi:hypothetical protein